MPHGAKGVNSPERTRRLDVAWPQEMAMTNPGWRLRSPGRRGRISFSRCRRAGWWTRADPTANISVFLGTGPGTHADLVLDVTGYFQ
jgi:hypothetical protein